MTSAGLASILDHAESAGLVARGMVNVISLEAIRERFGGRWRRRREDVWRYTERCCQRHFSAADTVRRIDETDFLVVAPAEEARLAQANCLRVLEEVVVFFLGSAELSDMRVRTVTAVQGDVLACTPVPPEFAPPKPDGEAPEPLEADIFANLTPMHFVAANGRALVVDFTTETVTSLQHRATAAIRLRADIHYEGGAAPLDAQAVGELAAADILSIDQRSMACLVRILEARQRRDQAVILPISYRTSTLVKGRMSLAALAAKDLGLSSRGLLELYDTTLGAPPSRVTESIGLLRHFARGVLLHVPARPGAAQAYVGCGQHGVVVTAGALGRDQREMAAAMLDLGENLRRAAPMRAVFDLPATPFLDTAHMAGFTHASVVPGGDDDA